MTDDGVSYFPFVCTFFVIDLVVLASREPGLVGYIHADYLDFGLDCFCSGGKLCS